jgi:hypothetical protein
VRRLRIVWVAAVTLIVAALAWQTLYELGIRECVRDSVNLLSLCAGPLDAWVLPLSLAAGLVLLMIGVWRLLSPR